MAPIVHIVPPDSRSHRKGGKEGLLQADLVTEGSPLLSVSRFAQCT